MSTYAVALCCVSLVALIAVTNVGESVQGEMETAKNCFHDPACAGGEMLPAMDGPEHTLTPQLPSETVDGTPDNSTTPSSPGFGQNSSDDDPNDNPIVTAQAEGGGSFVTITGEGDQVNTSPSSSPPPPPPPPGSDPNFTP